MFGHVKKTFCVTGSTSFFIRCTCPDQAKTLANVKIFGDGKVLADEEERLYWQKANQDRQEKLTGKVKANTGQMRGKDRVVRQFRQMEETKREQSNSHKFFEDDE